MPDVAIQSIPIETIFDISRAHEAGYVVLHNNTKKMFRITPFGFPLSPYGKTSLSQMTPDVIDMVRDGILSIIDNPSLSLEQADNGIDDYVSPTIPAQKKPKKAKQQVDSGTSGDNDIAVSGESNESSAPNADESQARDESISIEDIVDKDELSINITADDNVSADNLAEENKED